MQGIPRARLHAAAFAVLLVNSGYIAAFPRATIFFMANVVLHLAVGLGFLALAAVMVVLSFWAKRKAAATLARGEAGADRTA